MRNKRIGLIVLMVVMAMAFFTTPAGAAAKYYTCVVNQAGTFGTGEVRIMMTDTGATPKFANMWFECRTGQENRQLATALSALSSGMKVSAYVDPAVTTLTSRTISAIFLISE
jgi:hypothetical protein